MPSLAFLFRNDTWQSGRVFLGVIWSEKTHSLLETTEREKRVRRVNRRGEEKRRQWGLERDRRQIRTREKTNYEKAGCKRREIWEKYANYAATRGSIC